MLDRSPSQVDAPHDKMNALKGTKLLHITVSEES
jgi:hypothetical protein